MIGKLVKSKAGHDKDCIYIVISEDDRYAYLSDGKYKLKSNPKKKGKKHLQLINIESEVGNKIVQNEEFTDEEVKRLIKTYMQSIS